MALPYFFSLFFPSPAENRILFQRDLSSKGGNTQCQETKMNSKTQTANPKMTKKEKKNALKHFIFWFCCRIFVWLEMQSVNPPRGPRSRACYVAV